MHYATIDNQIGQSDNPPQDSIEITADQYSQAMQHKLSGGLVTVNDGEIVLYNAPVYALDGTERKERDSDEPLITTPPPDDLYVPQWDGAQWIESETDAQKQERIDKEWSRVRNKRDGLLSQTDWTVLPDAPLTQSKVDAYKTYRQELRNIPQNNDDPYNVEWPDEPT